MSAPFRIQYASRLFINAATCLKQKLIPAPKTKYLVLAGNCLSAAHSTTQPILSYLSANWEKVFIVPGTLEYSDQRSQKLCWQSMAEILRKQAMLHKNVYICEHSIHRLPEFTLLATPLGSAYIGNPAELIEADPPLENMQTNNGNLYNKLRFINEEDITFLQEALIQESLSKKPLVIATYQLPSIYLIGQDKIDKIVDGETNPTSLTGTVSFLPPKFQHLVASNHTPLKAWIAGASDSCVNMIGENQNKTLFTTNSGTSRCYQNSWFAELR